MSENNEKEKEETEKEEKESETEKHERRKETEKEKLVDEDSILRKTRSQLLKERGKE